MLKLRTMVVGAEQLGAGLAVDVGDTRITRVGAVLRRTSLDELPNLWNVLRGEMTLIGPRPTVPSQVAAYTDRQRRRLDVKPGLTGWAQVNGRASLPWSERIELDLHYIEHRSLAARPADPRAHRPHPARRPRALQLGPDRRLGRAEHVADGRRARTGSSAAPRCRRTTRRSALSVKTSR